MKTEIAVVGGGPAGLAAALALSQVGRQVHVFERADWPQDRACGEGILPDGLKHLQALGVTPKGMPLHGIEYHDARVGSFRGVFGEDPALGVRRTVLSSALVDACNAGVELHANCGVSEMKKTDQGWRLDTALGHVEAEFVVVADGPRSVLREQLGMTGKPPMNVDRLGWRQHLRIRPPSAFVEVHWGMGCEAYLTPVSEDELGVALLWREGFDVPKGKDRLWRWLDHFDGLKGRFDGAETASSGRGIGRMAVSASRATFDSGCFVGDALAFFDGISGEGLSAGFAQARILAQTLESGIAGGRVAGLEAALWRTLSSKRRLTHLLLQLHQRPTLRKRVFSVFIRKPQLFSWALNRAV
jgi:flavin-dependent dehydrogenase